MAHQPDSTDSPGCESAGVLSGVWTRVISARAASSLRQSVATVGSRGLCPLAQSHLTLTYGHILLQRAKGHNNDSSVDPGDLEIRTEGLEGLEGRQKVEFLEFWNSRNSRNPQGYTRTILADLCT